MCIPPDCLSISAGGFIQLACDISDMLQWLILRWHIYISGSFHVLKRGCLTLLWVGLSISSSFFWGGGFLFLPHPSPPSHSLRLFWVALLFDFSVSLLLCISAYRCLVMGLQGLGRVAREAGSWRGEGGGFILSKKGSGDCIFLQTDIIDSVLVWVFTASLIVGTTP